MISSKITIAIITTLVVSSSTFAENTTNHRMHEQRERIHNSIKSGELTHKEAKQLRHNENRIRHEEHRSHKNDGKLSKREAHHLKRMENEQSKAIYREKHNNQKGHD